MSESVSLREYIDARYDQLLERLKQLPWDEGDR